MYSNTKVLYTLLYYYILYRKRNVTNNVAIMSKRVRLPIVPEKNALKKQVKSPEPITAS